jgi:hypothetical protein
VFSASRFWSHVPLVWIRRQATFLPVLAVLLDIVPSGSGRVFGPFFRDMLDQKLTAKEKDRLKSAQRETTSAARSSRGDDDDDKSWAKVSRACDFIASFAWTGPCKQLSFCRRSSSPFKLHLPACNPCSIVHFLLSFVVSLAQPCTRTTLANWVLRRCELNSILQGNRSCQL